MAIVLLFLTTLWVAYANGANDNFKGVATLFGSDVTSYSGAIALGTIATAAGSLCSVFLAKARRGGCPTCRYRSACWR